uniref:Reverse transcriptase domain-containing protein n=1 Tax=Cannabis sativa TaxID=3483 RepID=A0A803PAR7_CANSA
MHCYVQSQQQEGKFFVSLIYAFNNEKKREELWADLEELAKKISETWILMGDFNEIMNGDERIGRRAQCNPSQRLQDCMENCNMADLKYSGSFYTWNNKQKPEERIFSKIDRAMEALAELQAKLNKEPQNVELMNQEQELRSKFAEVSKAFSSFMAQKAKVSWAKYGDENSHIFHASLKLRRIQNRIFSIEDEHGNWCDNPETVQHAFLDYYQKLLGTTIPARMKVVQAIVDLGPKVTSSHKDILLADYTRKEVEEAIFAIDRDKAPGPDGLYGRKNCKPSCMIKIDLRKAYDTIEWGFIEEMMKALGFPSLKLLSSTSGLMPNDQKTAIYCSGMADFEVNRVLEASNFKRSSLPFRYLGVPICSRKISRAECQCLLEKMTSRIREDETNEHLFFKCDYSTRCLQQIKRFLQWNTTTDDITKLLQAYHQTKRFNAARKSMVNTVIASLVYHIWKARNEALWNQQLWLTSTALQKILGMRYLREVFDEEKALGLWNKHSSIYMKKSLANKLFLKKRLYTLNMDETRELRNHRDDFNKIIVDLNNLGVKIDDEDQAIILLSSLPKIYEHFVDTIFNVKYTLTMTKVKGAFKSKEIQKKGNYSAIFLEEHNGTMLLSNNKACAIQEIGTVMIKNHDGKLQTLQQVRFVPEHKRNIMSIGMFNKSSYSVKIERGVMIMGQGSQDLIKGQLNNGLYFLDGKIVIGSAALAVHNPVTSQSRLWHLRLGHWRKLLENQIVNKLKVLRTYNGLEYCSGEFKVFCAQEGYPEGVKGYKLWSLEPGHKKCLISRDVVFKEEEMTMKTKLEDTIEDDSGQVEEMDSPESTSYQEEVNGKDGTTWLQAIDEEKTSLMKNKTWIMVKKLEGCKLVGCK